ncbi:MAG: tetratricopeptide repeat protein [Candidatus Heimdallarchaeota archaeon]
MQNSNLNEVTILENEKLFPEIEGFDVFGKPLVQIPLHPDSYDRQKKHFEKALQDYKNDPEIPENIIWLGRRTAYLGKFRNAIAIFTKGIEKFPDDPRMYRHRGHRFITLRMYRLAIADYLKAAELIAGKEDEIEPDGVPNVSGTPTSTLHSNVWYHLGLAHYLNGNYQKAYTAYKICLEISDNNDKIVSTTYWKYMTLRLMGKNKVAEKLLEKITKDMDIIENQQYFECLLMFKGLISAEKLLEKAKAQGAFGISTIGYGIANWYYFNGQKEKAKALLEEIVALDFWASFGYIAAEADLHRMAQEKKS